jgi:hypothetical protein
VILLEGSWNAWNFWFKEDAEFEDWVNGCLEEMERGLENIEKVREYFSCK